MPTRLSLTATVTTLAFFFASLAHASPAVAVASSTPVWTWAQDPANCKTDICISDCQTAITTLCASSDLTQTQEQTVGDCVVFYWYDAGNTVPTAAQCKASYGLITGPPSSAGAPNDCPGYVGGALGYDTSGSRTNDPVYMISPKNGNGNCMKAPGDKTSVLAPEALPNGQTIPQSCPAATSKSKRALAKLQRRDNPNAAGFGCNVGSMAYYTGCGGTCILEVTAAGWETGPFVAAGWLACGGICTATAVKAWQTCDKQNVNTNPPKEKRASNNPLAGGNPCLNFKDWTWPCPALEQSILAAGKCPTTATGSGTGSGSINT